MKKYTVSAAVAAGLLLSGLSVGSASAADLGGNCCADLEERVAELEATTERKGNRKVSLTISGWVAKRDYLKQFEAKLISPAEVALWQRGASNAGYHYLGCAKTFALMGQAFAEANLKMLAE